MNADFSHTCEGCEHVVTEPWAKDIISYKKGDRVLFNGSVYESLIDGNAYSPTAYPAGWKLIE